MEFGKNLKKLRMERGLSQKELADRAGVSDSAISSYEQRGKLPQLDAACAIAGALGVSLDTLVTGEEAAKVVHTNTVYRTVAGIAKAILAADEAFVIKIGQHEQRPDDPPLREWELDNYIPYYDPETNSEVTEPVLWADISIRNSELAQFVDQLSSLRKLQQQDVISEDVVSAWIEKTLSILELTPTGLNPDVIQWFDSIGHDFPPKKGKLTRIIEETP